ncbi:MAG TPA: hypothetical protein VHX65_18995 [Pirellulales bacterium]|jgi:hypothetical protein|nr:hypothetical protein [Pirellulales bacterium]
MSAERAIHEHWSGYRPLLNLVPIEQLYTGLAPIRDAAELPVRFPYVCMSVQGESQLERSSSGTTCATEAVRFAVYSSSYEEARRIEAMIVRYFNRRDFLWTGGRVLDMRPANHIERENGDDGVWMVARDFDVRIFHSCARISG